MPGPEDADHLVHWLIDSVQLEATAFHLGQYCGRWQASTSGRALGSFHLILHGSCYLHMEGQAPVRLDARDSVFLLRDLPHFLSPDADPAGASRQRDQSAAASLCQRSDLMPAGADTCARLPAGLGEWLQAHADCLDTGSDLASEVVPRLAGAGLFGTGVPEALGGTGGAIGDAIEAIAAVAEHSVTAAFVFWGQRTFIEYLLHSPNAALRERWLGPLVRGSFAGATGLSNAMKFLSGIESLQIDATPRDGGWQLDGALAWITNLRKEGFIAAAAVNSAHGAPPAVIAFTGDSAGVTRSADLDLMALRSSNTAAVKLEAVRIGAADVIHANAREYQPGVRPGFLGMQCGLSIGLARASLRSAHALSTSMRGPLLQRVESLQAALAQQVRELKDGVADGRFRTMAVPLFRLRLALADIVQQAVMLELQASGGKAYLQDRDTSFARRWREAAFIPIVTPSLTQLQVELQKYASA